MTKCSLAAVALMKATGSKIVARGQTIKHDGRAKRFSETLLIIPIAIAKILTLPETVQSYVDRKTKEEFAAVVLSATKPILVLTSEERADKKAQREAECQKIQQAARQRFEENLFAGQSVYHNQYGEGIVKSAGTQAEAWFPLASSNDCASFHFTDDEKAVMSKALVKIDARSPQSLFVYGQIVTQWDFFKENWRILKLIEDTKKSGKDPQQYRFLHATLYCPPADIAVPEVLTHRVGTDPQQTETEWVN